MASVKIENTETNINLVFKTLDEYFIDLCESGYFKNEEHRRNVIENTKNEINHIKNNIPDDSEYFYVSGDMAGILNSGLNVEGDIGVKFYE